MKKQDAIYLSIVIIMAMIILLAKTIYANELSITKKYCEGQAEVVLKDRTRCDCVTKKYAIEYEYANKWKEATGQTLHYSLMLKRLSGIVLIMKKKSDSKYIEMLKRQIRFYRLPIDLWVIDVNGVKRKIRTD